MKETLGNFSVEDTALDKGYFFVCGYGKRGYDSGKWIAKFQRLDLAMEYMQFLYTKELDGEVILKLGKIQ